jgi:hypothetical protein
VPEVVAAAEVPGPPEEAVALWDDPARWPAFVDGFRAVARADPDWPAPGSAITWDSTPHGQGRTVERSVRHGVREIETEQLRGTLTASHEDGLFVVRLDYELKQRSPFALFFVRRSLRDALRRTVARFATERRADAELGL